MLRYFTSILFIKLCCHLSVCQNKNDTCISSLNMNCDNQTDAENIVEYRFVHFNSSAFDDCRSNFVDNYQEDQNFSSQDNLFEAIPNYFCALNSNSLKQVGLNLIFNVSRENKYILIWIKTKSFVSCDLLIVRPLQDFMVEKYNHLIVPYGCHLFKINESGEDYSFTLVLYPQGWKRYFRSRVVNTNNFGNDFSKWELPTFVEYNTSHNSVGVLFHEIPSQFGKFKYTVDLRLHEIVLEEHNVPLNEIEQTRVHKVTFEKLLSDVNYTITVRAFENASNLSKETVLFPIFFQAKENAAAFPVYLLLIGLIVAAILFTVIVIILKWFSTSKLVPNEEIEVLVLYSHDNKFHLALVDAFVQLLKTRNFTVYFDKEEMFWNPYEWLKEHISKENLRIILVWSSGAIHKAQQHNKSLLLLDEPGNLTSHLFNLALKLIQSAKHNGNVVSVFWDESKRSDVVKLMPGLECYLLPKEWPSLIEHIYFLTQQSRHCFCCFPTESLRHGNLKTFPEGLAFLKAHTVMCDEGDYFKVIHRKISQDTGQEFAQDDNYFEDDVCEKTNYFDKVSESESKNPNYDKVNKQQTLSVVSENVTGNLRPGEGDILMHQQPSSDDNIMDEENDNGSSNSDESEFDDQEEGWLRNFLAV